MIDVQIAYIIKAIVIGSALIYYRNRKEPKWQIKGIDLRNKVWGRKNSQKV